MPRKKRLKPYRYVYPPRAALVPLRSASIPDAVHTSRVAGLREIVDGLRAEIVHNEQRAVNSRQALGREENPSMARLIAQVPEEVEITNARLQARLLLWQDELERAEREG